LYLHDPVAQVTRPVVRLIGYTRVPLRAGQAGRVSFEFHADLASFTGLRGQRIVEPGDLELRISPSSAAARHVVPIRLVGQERAVGRDWRMEAEATVFIAPGSGR
ncbi:MAG: fibronectin type III-like domain-contianing protein, partial [Micromonosporaceae bacterium]|nr:fibronectin type III-like domain-contianing protein [Micromonosporaceae bacterium]